MHICVYIHIHICIHIHHTYTQPTWYDIWICLNVWKLWIDHSSGGTCEVHHPKHEVFWGTIEGRRMLVNSSIPMPSYGWRKIRCSWMFMVHSQIWSLVVGFRDLAKLLDDIPIIFARLWTSPSSTFQVHLEKLALPTFILGTSCYLLHDIHVDASVHLPFVVDEPYIMVVFIAPSIDTPK